MDTTFDAFAQTFIDKLETKQTSNNYDEFAKMIKTVAVKSTLEILKAYHETFNQTD